MYNYLFFYSIIIGFSLIAKHSSKIPMFLCTIPNKGSMYEKKKNFGHTNTKKKNTIINLVK